MPRPAHRLTAPLAETLGQTVPARQALAGWDAERLYLRLAGGTSSDGAAEDAARRAHSPAPFESGLFRATPAPRIALAPEMSGSVDNTRLGLFLTEAQGSARRVMAEVWLIPFDDTADAPQRLDPARLTLPSTLRWGGGTAFLVAPSPWPPACRRRLR